MSIPVALHAALRHPSQLLGSHGAAALKAYQTSMEEFDRELGSLSDGDGLSLSGTVGVEALGQLLGMKRKRVD